MKMDSLPIRSFDLILVHGDAYISHLISFLQARQLGEKASDFSHVGIAIRADLLDDNDDLDPNHVYIWESVLGGNGILSDDVYDVEGKASYGVQLRSLDQLIETYRKSGKNERVAYCRLNSNLFNPDTPDQGYQYLRLKTIFNQLFSQYNGTRYDFNPVNCCSALFKCCRPLRDPIEKLFRTKDWLFCAELVALVYREIGLFPPDTVVKNVVPADFYVKDADGLPHIVGDPIYILGTPPPGRDPGSITILDESQSTMDFPDTPFNGKSSKDNDESDSESGRSESNEAGDSSDSDSNSKRAKIEVQIEIGSSGHIDTYQPSVELLPDTETIEI